MGIECMQRRDILHLLMHALGFNDEVTHPQRDQYVRILWDNINPGKFKLTQLLLLWVYYQRTEESKTEYVSQ